MITVQHWLTLGLVGALAGCGGGHDAPPVTSDSEVPAQVLATPQAFTSWMIGEAAARADDRAEPLKLGGAVPPVSDDTEPVALR